MDKVTRYKWTFYLKLNSNFFNFKAIVVNIYIDLEFTGINYWFNQLQLHDFNSSISTARKTYSQKNVRKSALLKISSAMTFWRNIFSNIIKSLSYWENKSSRPSRHWICRSVIMYANSRIVYSFLLAFRARFCHQLLWIGVILWRKRSCYVSVVQVFESSEHKVFANKIASLTFEKDFIVIGREKVIEIENACVESNVTDLTRWIERISRGFSRKQWNYCRNKKEKFIFGS